MLPLLQRLPNRPECHLISIVLALINSFFRTNNPSVRQTVFQSRLQNLPPPDPRRVYGLRSGNGRAPTGRSASPACNDSLSQVAFRQFLSFCASGRPSASRALSRIFWSRSSAEGCSAGFDARSRVRPPSPHSRPHLGFPCCSCSVLTTKSRLCRKTHRSSA